MTPQLIITNLSVNYGNIDALTDINLTINKGEYLGIIGPNGGGKSTLLKAILGLIPYQGKIEKIGENNTARISYVPQYTTMDRKFPISVLEVVLCGKLKSGFAPFFKYSNADIQNTLNILEKVGLKGYENRQISNLSGGEFQKMLIARAIVSNPEILLLDEPTANIDKNACSNIYQLINDLNKNITIILVTHDLFAVSENIKKIACLNRTMVYHGEPKLNEEIIDKLYGCPVDLIAHGIAHRVLSNHKELQK